MAYTSKYAEDNLNKHGGGKKQTTSADMTVNVGGKDRNVKFKGTVKEGKRRKVEKLSSKYGTMKTVTKTDKSGGVKSERVTKRFKKV